MLWGRSGNRCALPTCRKALVEDETGADDASIVGDEAHIVAREEDGPRGISSLTAEERDKFGNLILLCKIHHKLIDDQEQTYTVDVLSQMKQDHIEWVEKNLNPDTDKQKDGEIYASYVDRWAELANISNWKRWTSHLFGASDPYISSKDFKNLIKLNEYLLSRFWPKRYSNVEFALTNFRLVLTDFLNVFSKYKETEENDDEPWYRTKKFYKIPEWDPERYNMLSAKHDFHIDLVQDLGIELTRAANYVCDQVRKSLSPSYRINEGVLLIETGPDFNFKWTTARLEFKTNDQKVIAYPGLRGFMETRGERGYHFGEGVSEDYFPKSPF